MRFAPLALILSVCMTGMVRAAEPDVYIFDVLALQPYKSNLARLVKLDKTLPAWVKAIVAQGEGTAVPSRMVDIAGASYRLDHVCKVHECAGNTLDVLWAPRGTRVWAALVEGGKAPILLGKPPALQAKALTDAIATPTVATPAAAPTPAATPTTAPAAPQSPAVPPATPTPAAVPQPSPATPPTAPAPMTVPAAPTSAAPK